MKAAQFEHHEPTTVDEVVSLLESLDEPTILTGGQSLVPMLRFRLARPDTIVDINGIDSFDYHHEADGYLKIGALARHADIEDSDLVARSTEASPTRRRWSRTHRFATAAPSSAPWRGPTPRATGGASSSPTTAR
jgi:hypothetical protein